MSTRDHVKPALKQLHWLPVEQRISYKLCLLIHYCPLHSYWSRSTLSEQVCLHDLFIREQVQTQIVWRHTAAYCREHAPSLANVVSTTPVRPHVTLPSDLHDINNTNVFKKTQNCFVWSYVPTYCYSTAPLYSSYTALYKSLIIVNDTDCLVNKKLSCRTLRVIEYSAKSVIKDHSRSFETMLSISLGYNYVCSAYRFWDVHHQKWRDIEIGDRGRSKSLKMAPFDRW